MLKIGTADSYEQSHEYTRYVAKNSMIKVALFVKAYIKRTSDIYLFYRILSRYYFMCSRNSKTCCLAKSNIVPEKTRRRKRGNERRQVQW